jgi:hypothetical protein
MKYKHPSFGTTSTILKLATQLVAKSVRPGEALRSIERKIERMVKFLEAKSGMIDVPSNWGPPEITDKDLKLFDSVLRPRKNKRPKSARHKARRAVAMKRR